MIKRGFILFVACLVSGQAFASCILQEDTATTVPIKMVDGTDGITAETGLTIAQADIRLWKEGGTTFAQKNDATACTHRESGWYTCPLDATDTNTAGQLIIATDETVSTESVVPFELRCFVVASAYYDVLDATTSLMTSRQSGNPLKTTIDAVTSQTAISLASGPSNDDAFNNMTFYAVGGTEECEQRITDYTGSGADLTLEAACPFTLATSDEAYVFNGPPGYGLRIAQNDLDTITGTGGVTLEAGSITSSIIGTDAIDADAIADDSIDAGAIAADSIGASELAADSIGASEIATDAIGAAEIAADAIGSSELAATATAEIWDVSCEDQGGAYTCREILSVVFSEAVGQCSYASGTRIWTCKDPGGNEIRFTITYNTNLDGTRDSVTVTPVTP